ncbi:hypothetical protein N7539_001652 [Penicillium diatomitis]|uniref:AT DNA binding protein n=1 Tax=Penicillium diatomitis TaxID=2819901 RepID=A0A9W9XH44_9EURO|nr:uncharacterized protein N7539_001652 [Penicillium diatomitis]KAJ5492906.1 hypothetical protein N7539_001652 [Penicillium diatomitis]
MSITSRSQSSSPDILGPPGDAEYLISSPIKPFSGRQSWLSPAITKRHKTPAKRRRMTLSPTRSAHSIRFDDVLLPGSPAMKLDGYQKSLSPDKLLAQDGNVSPWRIRVTLEATQDGEDAASAMSSRKRPRPTTVTTMVPLKDEGSPMKRGTPVKRRIRLNDSETQPHNGSPWPRIMGDDAPGSIGVTPKRRPGRPRKNTPRPQLPSNSMFSDELRIENTPGAEPMSQNYSPMDITTDASANPDRMWSPMNISTDGDYESGPLTTNDLSVIDVPGSSTANLNTRQDIAGPRDYGRRSYNTPVISATEHHFLDDDNDIHSTPSKIPTPTRERLGSSTLSSHRAGGTVSPRTYPTPTPTSSLADEDTQAQDPVALVNGSPNQTDSAHERQQPSSVDPTDEHEEFDSIMESEGFTMVSLDTLPSAKQYGIGSSTKPGSEAGTTQGSGRIGDRLKRKLSGRIESLRGGAQTVKRPSPLSEAITSMQVSPRIEYPEIRPETRQRDSEVSYPNLPQTRSPEGPRSDDLRVGREAAQNINVQRTLEYGSQPETVDADEEDDIILQHDDEERHHWPHQIGRRHNSQEWEDASVEDMPQQTKLQDRDESQAVPNSLHQVDSPRPDKNTARASREREWQRERERVSRQARDPVNSGKFISVESDEPMPQEAPSEYSAHGSKNSERSEERRRSTTPLREELANNNPLSDQFRPDEEFAKLPLTQPVSQGVERPIESPEHEEDEEDEEEDIWRVDDFSPKVSKPLSSQSRQDPRPVTEDADLIHDDDDDDGDIWQQEARDQSNISHHSEKQAQPDVVQRSPGLWREAGEHASTHESRSSSSPVYVTIEHHDGTHPVPTHIRKLRDQNVDLSALLAHEETPNRANYYDGTSTPREMLNRRLVAPLQSAMKSASSARKVGQRVRLQPMPQSSPHIGSDAEFSYSPAFKPNISRHDEDTHGSEVGPDAACEATNPFENSSAATPRSMRRSQKSAEESTWFQQITSLTPRWLKAPEQDEEDSSSSIAASQDDPDSEFEHHDDQTERSKTKTGQSLHGPAGQLPVSDRSSQSLSRSLRDSANSPPKDPRDHVSSAEPNEARASSQSGQGTSSGVDSRAAPEGARVAGDQEQVDRDQDLNDQHQLKRRSRPLSTFGYFSDEHYKALQRLYQLAKRAPERFSYHKAAGRTEIIGDWIWTSDGLHGVPITELQFAIIDRFVHDLSRADVEYGGSGRVEWTEADLHRRLISIIIGEQIRENQKAKTVRAGSVDTWR